jgi:hypothetical protein
MKFLKDLLKRRWRRHYADLASLPSAKDRFVEIYRGNLWRSRESVSGYGSTVKFTKNIREAIPQVIDKLKITSMLDAPCGDLNWMRLVLPDLKDMQYIGADIVDDIVQENASKFSAENVRFVQLDLVNDPMPRTGLLFCRDCLFHLSFEDTRRLLCNFVESGTDYLFTTTYDKGDAWENTDILTGYFREIDLSRKPYFLPKDCVFSVLDGKPDNTDRFMKVWTREQVSRALLTWSDPGVERMHVPDTPGTPPQSA